MKQRQEPYLATSTKQRGCADALVILVFIAVFASLVGLLSDMYYTGMSLQEVQKLEQKCIEQQGVPEYKVLQANKAVKGVLCKKGGNLYEEF